MMMTIIVLQAYEFFLFAGVMVLDMVLMAILTRNFKYVDQTSTKIGEGQTPCRSNEEEISNKEDNSN